MMIRIIGRRKKGMPKEEFRYQNVIITLSDGSRHTFTGKAICEEGETRRISKVEFSLPKPLPVGYTLEEMNND